MPIVHNTNLLIVVAVGLLAPLALGFFPRLRLHAIATRSLFHTCHRDIWTPAQAAPVRIR